MKKDITLSQEQIKKISLFIEENNREVPLFYEGDVCEVIYVPVDGAELRVFHHKPKNPITQRPILFVSGFGTSPWSWRHFNTVMYEKGEYYFLETREKSSSKLLTKRRKAKMSIDQNAKDLARVISYLGLDKKDFLLFGTSYCGAIILVGLANKYFTAPTIAIHDPLESWKVQRRMLLFFFYVPPFVLSAIKMPFARLILLGLKNKAAKKRYLDFVRNATVWKWIRSGWHNFSFKIDKYLPLVNEEVLILHGTKDRYHNDEVFEDIALNLTNGRYFYMDSPNEFRELIVGIFALEIAKIGSGDAIPPSLNEFHVDLKELAKNNKKKKK
ncbi:MAG: alpha/beta hydrolase [Candidatus Heimdallarchaeota archaeon]|nr:alpha/beta hydrolase [Candidatus Heimdallarchaeota archaeon]